MTPGAGARPVRAAVLDKPGTPLRVETLLLDPPAAGEVLVRLEASGVCHSDLHVADGEWGDTEPIVLGHEGCGVVEEVGTRRRPRASRPTRRARTGSHPACRAPRASAAGSGSAPDRRRC